MPAEGAAARGPRAGFTIIELLVVLLVASVVGAMAWTLAQVGTSVHRRELRRADAERTRRNIETVVGGALAGAASGGFSAPNLGMVRVGTPETARGDAADTLVVLRVSGGALAVASRPCAVARPLCIALRGEAGTRLRPGDLLAVGSSRVGYRLLEVSAAGAPYAAPCGADCPPATFCALEAVPGGTVVEVLLGKHTPVRASAPSCAESYYPDGSRCTETLGSRPVAARMRSVCRSTEARAWFVDVETSDRTAALGFPAPREWVGVSGGGAPDVRAIPVDALRVFAAPEGPELALQAQRGFQGGSWAAARRVAGPIASFRVEATHAGSAAWIPGDGVDHAGLAVSPNRMAHGVPGGAQVGYRYARGYHTLVGIRVQAEVVGQDREGRRTTEPVRILQSLAPAARGGAREEP
ncbi:prepilin-type N-terminal cleavage/methylation domain-containing protein [Longimicrobium terrae]|uniref:Prepilin-type N-terminal cleavage/methylation domain-containing protein n=1 Tax=Longimicrobium terrae TaxID=1639882 RepID=A0A841GRV8_9BACT|nr:prepilin-type N-terminal cleavage/methylation domain-containing protein [Longimicrobium terrae]MBB4635986.1 prepilin-type N-terminal cleavage/methylation domain-containing protein [Longimicrobium terrae]MBB6070382.1 prepilin-type N-terminal cleavage/methylation domain-containing protein [Longimicrobium terrae]NNC30879.1 prepilin-type N-terminal cleavage/methylation domain-containing protein [Longimicrobium terrae]